MGQATTPQALSYRIERLEENVQRLGELSVETNNLARLDHQIIELVLHPNVKSLLDAQSKVRALEDESLRARTALTTLRWVGVGAVAALTLVISWLATRAS